MTPPTLPFVTAPVVVVDTAGWRPVLGGIVLLLALAVVAWSVPGGPVHRWRLRRRMLALLDPDLPADERERARAVVRAAVPRRRREPDGAVLPRGLDPTELRVVLEVPATPDGCPGFRLSAPWDSRTPPAPGGSTRQPVTVLLGGGRALLVVVLGRVGQVDAGHVLVGAADRPHLQRASARAGLDFRGDVTQVPGPGGPAWRHTFAVGSALVTDTHLERDGWAFVVGVTHPDGDTSVAGLCDAVLTSWSWDDDPATGAAPADAGRPGPGPDAPAEATACGVVLGDERGDVARCLVPAAPVAADVPCADGATVWAYVRLTSTGHLAVTSAPWDGVPGAARGDLEQPRRTAWGLPVAPAGPVSERRTGAGTVLVRTFHVNGLLRTDVRLDRAGRRWTWSLTRRPDERHLLAVLDDVLRTWQWAPFPPDLPPASEAPADEPAVDDPPAAAAG